MAWESSGQDVLIAWGDSTGGNRVRYLTWQKGTSLADLVVQSGPDLQASVSRVLLAPLSGTEKIILPAANSSNQLRYSLWNGNRFVGDPAILLESNMAAGALPFGIAESVPH